MITCPCTWTDFIKWVIPYVASPKDEFKRAPDAMIEQFVRRVAYDFAFDAGVLRDEFCQDVQCGVVDYPIQHAVCHEVVSIKAVILDDIPLTKRDYYSENEIVYLNDAPIADLRNGLCIRYAFAPCMETECAVPDVFCGRYREAIIAGTIAKLLAMPSMDWYSATESERQKEKYDTLLSRARSNIRNRSGRRKTIYDASTRFIR